MSTPPVAKKQPQVRVHHGDEVVDDYEWLRDPENADTLAYLEAENAYAAERTAHLEDLRDRLFEETRSRIQETDLSVPVRRGDWWYYARTFEGREYAVHCRCPVDDPTDWTPPTLEVADGSVADIPGEQVLLDANAEAEGHDFFSLGALSVSRDGHLLAYSTDTTGDERFTLRVKDLRTGEVHPDEIAGVSYGATWSLDATHLFYSTVDDAWRPDKVWRHALGSAAAEDALVFHETDERYFTGVGATRSDRYLMVVSSSKVTSEVRVLDAADPTGDFRVVARRRDGIEYSVEHAVIGGEDRFLVLHNDAAVNFTLASVGVDDPSPQHWRTEIAHSDQVRLEDVDAFADFLAVSMRKDALAQVALIRLDGLAAGAPLPEAEPIAFDEPLFTSGLGSNPEWDQPLVRIGYTSFVTPETVYDYLVGSGELVLRRRQPVLGGYDPADYEQHREWVVARDGTHVPVSVVVRRGVPRDGSAPAMIYGYGAYEASMDPSFRVSRLSLLDRGMVFAVAHVRGGGEMGRGWYDDGKMLAKKNTFTDFVDCARHLATTGWTSADRLVAEGGSAGGLLMGAVANDAPDAFAGILAVVPFVDALTSILDPSLPLTVIEWDEWGDPLHDPDVYAYMKSYTPYENVREQDYPRILAVTSLHDTRVLYVEPAKWVARLRDVAGADVLLKTEMSAGHGGVSGRYESWKERAYELAWVIDVAGAPYEPVPSST
ncbi:oligopeptidase B [Mumia flava]|uniref:Oligopeptidase B n=1 Tax=Mumia flava TaxID=1348852 RepID=A0A0B2BI35_9ACTN|nr:S9 family peptidase [Mumia flava]PJJ55956.1 oligopeptidase B [Mumia flava]